MWPGWVNVTFSRDELKAELSSALRAAWAEYRAGHAGETPYAFGLTVVSEDGWIVGSAYATEESTIERAAQYAYMLSGTDAERAQVIRWWDADWVYCNDLRSLFDRSNDMLRALARAEADFVDTRENGASRRRRVEASALEAIREELYLSAFDGFSADLVLGVFGSDPARTARSIERLNSAERFDRWRREVEQGDRAYAALQR